MKSYKADFFFCSHQICDLVLFSQTGYVWSCTHVNDIDLLLFGNIYFGHISLMAELWYVVMFYCSCRAWIINILF